MFQKILTLAVAAVIGGCGGAEEFFDLDCAGVEGTQFPTAGDLIVTYQTEEDRVLLWAPLPPASVRFIPPDLHAHAGRARTTQVGVQPWKDGLTELALFDERGQFKLASCEVEFLDRHGR